MQGIGWFLRKAIGLASVTLHVRVYTEPASSGAATTTTASSTEAASPLPSQPSLLSSSSSAEHARTVTHIDIEQTATGGIKGTTELRTLDWKARPHADYVFGKCEGRSKWVDLEANDDADVPDDAFLKEGWLKGPGHGGGPNGRMLVLAYVKSLERDWEGYGVRHLFLVCLCVSLSAFLSWLILFCPMGKFFSHETPI